MSRRGRSNISRAASGINSIGTGGWGRVLSSLAGGTAIIILFIKGFKWYALAMSVLMLAYHFVVSIMAQKKGKRYLTFSGLFELTISLEGILVSTALVLKQTYDLSHWVYLIIGGALGTALMILVYACKVDFTQDGTSLLFVVISLVAIPLMHISRETALMAFPFLISGFAQYAGENGNDDSNEMTAPKAWTTMILLVLVVASHIYCFTVWGKKAVVIDIDDNSVVYNLDKSEGSFVIKKHNGCGVIEMVNAPNAEVLVIENGYTEIDDDAFKKCESMEKLIIPSSVLKICEDSSKGCKELEEVYIGYNPDGTKSAIPASLNTIEYGAFNNTSIKRIYFNGSMASWENVSKEGNDDWLSEKAWDHKLSRFEVICNDGTMTFGN